MEDMIEYYVSPEGNDSNNGLTQEEPFKTIQHAKNSVREQIKNGIKCDITVYLRGGEYYLDTPLTFDENDSHKDGFKVSYKNFPNEVPVINGGQAINGWVPYKGNIYKTNVKKGWVFHGLFEDGVCCSKARFPKEGYSNVEAMLQEAPKSSFIFKTGDIPKIKDTKDLQVYIWSGGPNGDFNWFSNVINVENVDFENRIVTMQDNTAFVIGPGSRYYVKGALELLTGPGEFYLDSESGTLYYWPRKKDIESANIVAPKMERIIEVKGSTIEKKARNLVFEGLTIRNTDTVNEMIVVKTEDCPIENGTIYLENAENIHIRNSIIHNTGMHGIYLFGAASNNKITGNLIYDVGHTGIQIAGYFYSSKDVSHDNIIRNNHIYDTGRLVGHGAGIQIMQSSSNIISHNRIHHTSRYSISLKLWPAGFLVGRTIDGITVTRENAGNFSLTRNNIIEFNDVSHANVDSQDTGPIEAWGAGPGNIIRNNRLHDSEINFSFGVGLYLDDAANYFEVYNNVINGLQKTGKGFLGSCIYAKGIGNRIYNNIVADNNSFGQCLESFEMHGEPNRDLEIQRNIFYNSGYLYGFQNWSDDRFKSCDHNVYFNTKGDYRVTRRMNCNDEQETYTFEEWKGLLNNKYDQHSLIQDPLFMDAENEDYRLKSDSPAYDLGFTDIDLEDIGLEKDYPYPDSSDELHTVYIRNSTEHVNHSWILLAAGEEARLSITGRTGTGFVADLSKAEIYYSSSDNSIGTVDNSGYIKAYSKGISIINVTVKAGNITKNTAMHLIVK